MQPRDAAFPKVGAGFHADIKTSEGVFRLFAHVTPEGWKAEVYNMDAHRWFASEWADDADDAKRKAQKLARRLVPGEYPVVWKLNPKPKEAGEP